MSLSRWPTVQWSSWFSSYSRWVRIRSSPCFLSLFRAARMAIWWVVDEWTVGREKALSRFVLSHSGQLAPEPPRTSASNSFPQSWQEYS